MQMHSCVRALLPVCLGLLLSVPQAKGQLQQLVNRVPDSANAIVVVNAKAVYASPLAQKNGWNQPGHQAHDVGMIALPHGVDWFLMAAAMDYEFMQPLWEIAVAHVRKAPSMSDIAKRSGGRVDRLAGVQAVERPNDSFVVALGPRVVGAMSPANRQQVVRWVRESRTRKSPELSTYLAQVVDDANDSTSQIVLALDLHGILAPAEVAAELATIESIKDKDLPIEKVAESLAGVTGMQLKINLQDPPHGELQIDFGEEVSALSGIAKPVLMEVFHRHGANIEDVASWPARVADYSMVMEGQLSASGLRRVLTLLSGPVGPTSAASPGETESTDDDVAAVSQWYFRAITNYLNDLFVSDLAPQSLYQAKIWVERYARKIQDLDDYQVDPDVLAYGNDVVASLQEIVHVIERTETRSDLREANLYDSGRRRYGRYGVYGWFEKGYVTRDRELVQADETVRGIRTSQVIVDELRALTAETRQTMNERYGRDF